MPWDKKDPPDSIKNLEPPVKDKAVEIANKLIEKGYEEARAIPIAISRSKEWFENRGVTVSSDITHHLLPEKNKWIIKKLNSDDRLVFTTKEEAMDKVKEMSKNKAVKVMTTGLAGGLIHPVGALLLACLKALLFVSRLYQPTFILFAIVTALLKDYLCYLHL
jgi:uncharacterized protein YdaT